MRYTLLILGYLWSAPMTLLGLMLAVLYRPVSIRFSEGAIELVAGTKDGHTRIWGRPGAQTLGCVIWCSSEESQANPRLRLHERYHIMQFMVGSVFFSIVYGLEFLWRYLIQRPTEPARYPRWKRAYWHLSWERKARECTWHPFY